MYFDDGGEGDLQHAGAIGAAFIPWMLECEQELELPVEALNSPSGRRILFVFLISVSLVK